MGIIILQEEAEPHRSKGIWPGNVFSKTASYKTL